MPSDCISFRDTNYFSSLICDYLDQSQDLQPFYNRFPLLENFEAQIQEKKASHSEDKRSVLVTALKSQYNSVKATEATLNNIEALGETNAFTITTGASVEFIYWTFIFFI